ncbi:MAG: winged helix-turn-helix domain-containing protein, partial [Clostridia bacterium]
MYTIITKKLTEMLDVSWKPIDHSEVPAPDAQEFKSRISRLWAMKEAEKYSAIIIYGDREHFSNMHYFTDLDPRFEEALLVLFRDRRPIIVLGNENMSYSGIIPYDIDKKLYQTFSLMGQPNDARSPLLPDLIRSFCLPAEGQIGLIGWKYYNAAFHADKCLVTDVPHYIVAELLAELGQARLENATDLLTDNVYGLKHHVSAKEIVRFEVLGTKATRNAYNCIRNLKPGMTEIEASAGLSIDGDPLATHPNINFGDAHTSYGLSSPKYYKKLELGEFIGVGYSLRGSNVHKSGIYTRSEKDVPADRKCYIEEMAKPYFACIARWYEMMRIGASCGDIWQMVEDWIGFEKFGISLNPGTQQVSYLGEPVALTPKEYQLLHELLSPPGRVMTRDQLM